MSIILNIFQQLLSMWWPTSHLTTDLTTSKPLKRSSKVTKPQKTTQQTSQKTTNEALHFAPGSSSLLLLRPLQQLQGAGPISQAPQGAAGAAVADHTGPGTFGLHDLLSWYHVKFGDLRGVDDRWQWLNGLGCQMTQIRMVISIVGNHLFGVSIILSHIHIPFLHGFELSCH